MRVWLATLLLLLTGWPLVAQETMLVKSGSAAPAFTCVEDDCERLAWLPAGASVAVIGQVEGRELEGSNLWYEALLDCPCFDYERRTLADVPDTRDPDSNRWFLWYPYWSPDSSLIATVAGSDLVVWDAKSGERLVKEPLDIFYSYHMAWSPDGARIIAGGGVYVDEAYEHHYEPERNLLVVSADGRDPAPLPGQDGGVWDVAWSHDGTRIAAVGTELRIWDAQQDSSLLTIDASAQVVDWSPDDTRIITSSYEGGLQVWDAASGALLNSLGEGADDHIADVAWSPDGARIAYTINLPHTINDVRTDYSPPYGSLRVRYGAGQDHPAPLAEAEGWIMGLSWSPDGRFLVYGADGAISIMDADDGQVRASLTPTVTPYNRDQDSDSFLMSLVDWSPDGKHIAAAGQVLLPRGFELRSAALVWDLTLIPDGQTRAFIHSSHLILEAPADS